MINVATIHWQDMRWIDIQLRYLDRFIDGPHRVWSFLGEEGADHVDKFHYANTLPIRPHSWKLDLLGDLICEGAGDDELILFIDGDAFPIAPVIPYAEKHLADYPLLAIRRDENDGDPQPHPCFCITTVGFWREIGGTWERGATWPGPLGVPVTDVGGNLRQILIDRGIDWYPILRSNARNPHPLLFGVYDDVVYHHGAGFRSYGGGRASQARRLGREAELSKQWRARVIDAVPQRKPFLGLERRLRPKHPVRRYRQQLRDQFLELSEAIYGQIQTDPDFFRMFTDADQPAAVDLSLPPLVAEVSA